MTKRSGWEFSINATEIGHAAGLRAAYHRERADWWAREGAKAEMQLRSDGVRITETGGTGGPVLQASLDPTLNARVNECRTKRLGHVASAEEYERWVTLMGMQDGFKFFELHADDVAYFGLGYAAPLPEFRP